MALKMESTTLISEEPKKIKIGIVGPEELKWSERQKTEVKMKINQIFNSYDCEQNPNDRFFTYKNLVLVSGHCPKGGVDIWAEEIADELGIQKEIYPVEVERWGDYEDWTRNEVGAKDIVVRKGYRSRNIQIAEACDILYCIVPFKLNSYCYHHKPKLHGENKLEGKNHPSNGGCWTKKYTKKIGKQTYLIVIE